MANRFNDFFISIGFLLASGIACQALNLCSMAISDDDLMAGHAT